jgi:hypothetical protein
MPFGQRNTEIALISLTLHFDYITVQSSCEVLSLVCKWLTKPPSWTKCRVKRNSPWSQDPYLSQMHVMYDTAILQTLQCIMNI